MGMPKEGTWQRDTLAPQSVHPVLPWCPFVIDELNKNSKHFLNKFVETIRNNEYDLPGVVSDESGGTKCLKYQQKS